MCVHRVRDPVGFTGFLLYFLKNIFRNQRERRSRELSSKGSLCQEENGQGGGSTQEPTQVFHIGSKDSTAYLGRKLESKSRGRN